LDDQRDGRIPPGIPARSLIDVGLRALANYGDIPELYSQQLDVAHKLRMRMAQSSHTSTWSRHTHVALWTMKYEWRDFARTDDMFTTLLLGIRRLETTGVLVPSHDSMLEDMLECWTWHDHSNLDHL
jgi:hypothetical protein